VHLRKNLRTLARAGAGSNPLSKPMLNVDSGTETRSSAGE
jgi:hypothetical protein